MKRQFNFLLICFLSQLAFSQPGTIDYTFNPGDIGFGNGEGPDFFVKTIVKQTDGKILIGGRYSSYNRIPRGKIARLNPDGTLDHTFNSEPGFDPGSFDDPSVNTILLLEDGKVLVGGRFINYNGQAVKNLVRLNSDGSLDESFNVGSGPNNDVEIIRKQNDGKIYIGGWFKFYDGQPVKHIARLHSDGSIDNSFQGPDFEESYKIESIEILQDGRILAGGGFANAGGTNNNYLIRLMPNGSVDPTFNTNFSDISFPYPLDILPSVKRIFLTNDNKYLIAGSLPIPGLEKRRCVLRLNGDGSLDDQFQIPVMISYFYESPQVNFLMPWAQDRFLISGNFKSVNGHNYLDIASLKSDGTIDTSFQQDEIYRLNEAIYVDNNQLLIAQKYSHHPNSYLHRISEDFIYDPTFNPVTGANERVNTIHTQNDGNILISGLFTVYNGHSRKGIARLLPDGAVDTTFNLLNSFRPNSYAFTLAEQTDGKILAGGNFTVYNDSAVNRLMRLTSDGSLDNTFNIGTGASKAVVDIKIQDADKIIVAGAFGSFNDQPAGRIVRLNHDGSIDESFDTGYGANNSIMCIALQPNDKIIIGGTFTMFDSIPGSRIARLNPDGNLDMDFDPGNGFQSYGGVNYPVVNAIGLQQDGKIIVTGNFLMYNDVTVNRVVRLNQDGSLDPTFNPGNGANNQVESMTIQPDGKIILVGNFTMFDSIPANRIVRLNENGSVDTTFVTGAGANGRIHDVAIHEHERIIIAGDFTAYDGTGRNRIARIMGDEPDGVRSDFRLAALKVYPNPAQDFIYLEADRYLQGAMIRLYDLQGRILQEQSNISGRSFRIDLAGHKPGVYMVEVISGELIGRQKVIRQ